tara:strand:+ start:10763 stop:11788 length:1026 start_codon:yes stop_codon:yes gene_type:complete
MDNIIIVTDSESDSDYSDSHSDHDEREEVVYENTHFMNHVETEEYKKNRNQLFTKDIETRSLLVDTNNIQKTSNFNTNDYTYNLFSENNNTDQNTTGGYDSYKNVIGFRLIRAIIPNTAYTINDMNNSIVYSTTSGTIETITITLIKGYYTLDNLANAFPATADLADSNVSGATTINNIITTTRVTIPTPANHKFKFQCNTTSVNFKFVWNTNDKTKNAARLFGFYPVESSTNASHTSDFVPDMSNHFVDVVVDEIPKIACKDNPTGKNTIERIYMDNDYGSMKIHESIIYGEQNYFYPITLEKLSIKLYSDDGKTLYDSQKANHSFEFEITTLKNTELVR